VVTWVRRAVQRPGVSLRPVEVNGSPGAMFFDTDQRLVGVLALDIGGGQIKGINSVVNPEKLAHLGPVGDLRSLLGPPA
jgi:RNA polymerase sigma-70 factor (ECF subfamily)